MEDVQTRVVELEKQRDEARPSAAECQKQLEKIEAAAKVDREEREEMEEGLEEEALGDAKYEGDSC